MNITNQLSYGIAQLCTTQNFQPVVFWKTTGWNLFLDKVLQPDNVVLVAFWFRVRQHQIKDGRRPWPQPVKTKSWTATQLEGAVASRPTLDVLMNDGFVLSYLYFLKSNTKGWASFEFERLWFQFWFRFWAILDSILFRKQGQKVLSRFILNL